MAEPTRSKQIEALIFLINSIRPDWNPGGVRKFLTGSSAPIADLAIAGLLAARDRPDQRTPAVITLDGPHWHVSIKGKSDTEALPEPDLLPRCVSCNHRVTAEQHDAMEARVAPEFRHTFQPWTPEWEAEQQRIDQQHRTNWAHHQAENGNRA